MQLDEVKKKLKAITASDLLGEEAHIMAYPKFRIERYKDAKPTTTTRKSAVLILFYMKDNTPFFCLIKRPKYNGYHSSQVAFPGGKFETGDHTLENTAIRETKEEVGISQNDLEVVGKLSTLFIPVSDFEVTPYIAIARKELNFTPSRTEVDYIVHANFERFLNTPIKEMDVIVDDIKISAPAFLIEKERVWGATAMILSELQLIYQKL